MEMACAHCGNPCEEDQLVVANNHFCCQGCSIVYDLLHNHQLDAYYQLQNTPGTSFKSKNRTPFPFLDLPQLQEELHHFFTPHSASITLFLPAIHCSSCIWLLGHLHRLHPGVVQAVVNFPKREARVVYNPEKLSLRELAELLDSIGYAPDFKLDRKGNTSTGSSKKEILQLGVAGFVFGNVMLLALPEYFGTNESFLEEIAPFLRGVMLVLSVPLVAFSALPYFGSAMKGLRNRYMNMDVPIALGISVLFLRSVYEIFTGTGAGYLDSLAGLVFFLLLGRWYQRATYKALNFERDYKAYFPIAVTTWINNQEEQLPLEQLQPGMVIILRHGELLPVDGELLEGKARMDNSFVTGESEPIPFNVGETLLAGGVQTGGIIKVKTLRAVNQSYLTQLWNHSVFAQDKPGRFQNLTDRISKQFTIALLVIALGAGLFWYMNNPTKVFEVVTAVLIVACPCALALSAPFALGNTIRLMGRRRAFVKNADTIEHLGKSTQLVFDKTGTLTSSEGLAMQWVGTELLPEDAASIKNVARSSQHPMSKAVVRSISTKISPATEDFMEHTGAGISGRTGSAEWKIGRSEWVGSEASLPGVWVSKNGEVLGHFVAIQNFRNGLPKLFNTLQKNYSLALLTGDNNQQEPALRNLMGPRADLRFNQRPEDKLKAIESWQNKGEVVTMVGDGLNDAGALQQSHVGISLAEDVNAFSPACDLILAADQLPHLNKLLTQAKQAVKTVHWSFALSFAYNLVGLSFAVAGMLSPLVSAILMPLSSVTIVAFVTASTYLTDRKIWKST